MSGLAAALWTETLKSWRSKVPLVTVFGLALAPIMGGFFMYVLEDPDRARRLGLIGAKAHFMSERADWPSYFSLLAQATAVGGLLVFGLVAIWIFGREHQHRTIRDLLALPTSREAVVVAKFAVYAVWCASLTLITFTLGLFIGALVGLPGWSQDSLLAGLALVAISSGMTILVATPFGAATSAGRGYLPATGVMLVAVFLAQVIATAGWGAYFPWSIPAMYSGASGHTFSLGVVSVVSVVATGFAGLTAALGWWRFADHT